MGDLTTHPECQALLRAILTDPADDLPRLLYADRLEETGEGERAEFIRVQVELAGLDDREPHCDRYVDRQCCYCAECTRYRSSADKMPRLRRRERELLTGHFGAWTNELPESLVTRPCPYCEDRAADWETNVVECGRCECTGFVSDSDRIGFHRGFVASVDLTAADFLVHAAALFAAQPITEVRLTDRHPAEESTGWVRWHGNDGENLRFPDRLPMVVYDRLTGEHLRYDYRPDFDPNVYYPSADAAHAALFRACVAYGREQAGLPPLPEDS